MCDVKEIKFNYIHVSTSSISFGFYYKQIEFHFRFREYQSPQQKKYFYQKIKTKLTTSE